MFTMPEQFVEAAKSQIGSHLTMINALTRKTFVHVEKIISLNIATTKVSIQESNATFQKLFSMTGPQEFFSVTIAQVQPCIEKFRSYGQNLIELSEEMATEPTQAIEEVIISSAEVTPAKKQPSAPAAVKHHVIQLDTLPVTESRPPAQPAIIATSQFEEIIKPEAAVTSVIEESTAKTAVGAAGPAIGGVKSAAEKIDINPVVIPNVTVKNPVTNKIATKPAVKAAPIKPAVASNQAWQAPKITHPAKK